MEIWFVIPAYNEAAVIETTIVSVLSRCPNVIVVDDHSQDNTFEIATKAGALVCRHPINLGQGAALQTGIDYALLSGADAIVTFDADGQHNVDEAMEMAYLLEQNDNIDVVLGSRFLTQKAIGISATKAIFLKAAAIFTRFTSGLKVTDAHNGLRCFSRMAASKIKIRQNRMAHASEISNQIADLKLRYTEFPVTITYTDYSRAKGQKMSGAFRILYDLAIGRLYK